MTKLHRSREKNQVRCSWPLDRSRTGFASLSIIKYILFLFSIAVSGSCPASTPGLGGTAQIGAPAVPDASTEAPAAAPVAAALPAIGDRTADDWIELGKSNYPKFMSDRDHAGELNLAGFKACSKKIADNIHDHPEFVEKLDQQRLQYTKECKANCTDAASAKAAGTTCPSTPPAYGSVLNICQVIRSTCEESVAPEVKANVLRCDCRDLCDDRKIDNVGAVVSHCAEGFTSLYQSFWNGGKAAIGAIGTAVSDPGAVRDSTQNWWRSLTTASTSTVAGTTGTGRDAMIGRQSAQLAQMAERLKQCQDSMAATGQADYVGAKINELAMSCMNIPTRTQQDANTTANVVCSLVAPVPPIFGALRLLRARNSIVPIFKAASEGGKAALNEVFRSGAAVSEKAAKLLAAAAKNSASATISYLKKMTVEQVKSALNEIESKCPPPQSSTRSLWEEAAFAQDAPSCVIGILRKTVEKADGSHAAPPGTVAPESSRLPSPDDVRTARTGALEGKAGYRDLSAEHDTVRETEKLAAMRAEVKTSGRSGNLALGEQAQAAAEASASTLAGVKTAGSELSPAQKLFAESAKSYRAVAEDVENGTRVTKEKAEAMAAAHWQAAAQDLRAGPTRFGEVDEDLNSYASRMGMKPEEARASFRQSIQQKLDDAQHSAGFRNGSRLSDIQQVRDYATYLRAQAAAAGQPTAAYDAVLTQAAERQASYASRVASDQYSIQRNALSVVKASAYDTRREYQVAQAQFKSAAERNPAYATTPEGQRAQARVRALSDQSEHNAAEYARIRANYLDRLTPAQRTTDEIDFSPMQPLPTGP